MDLLTLLIWVAFYVLFAASIRQFLRRRGSLELAVVLVFASSAGIFLVSAVSGVVPSPVPLLSPVAVTLLIAQPALMLRLVSLFVPLRPWAPPAATAGFVLSLGLFYGTGRSVASILLVVAYFVGTETIAAVALMRESRRRHGFARARLATAAAASLLFGITILVSGVASAARGGAAGQDPAGTLVARSLGLLAGLGYLFAFVPPAWLRSLGHRALAYDLVRRIVTAPAGAQTRMLWESFAGSAADVLGASSVRVLVGGAVIAYDNATAPRSDARQALEVPIELDGRTAANLVADVSGRPLFIEDDIALVQLLGSLTARSAESALAIGAVADAARATADAEAVLRSESRFRALLDAEPNAVLVTDRSGSITWSTAAAAAMFGMPSDELVGRRLDELVAPPPAPSPASADSAGTTRYETT